MGYQPSKDDTVIDIIINSGTVNLVIERMGCRPSRQDAVIDIPTSNNNEEYNMILIILFDKRKVFDI